ncbi:Putative DAK phosphatase domain containing protein [Sodalis praecaptivus]|uniref:Putative DAK phosphatase domain containing protein n=1 Tax=Sodalis praecaptivus TaxID=1239307 RepID=W0HUA0_9GAMM|nr:DAK2 domain-containing protein [Sodalis praecaptivus]AHF77416.1 Putative DAK phosphatase domain containing protein [Sodalis praecaptivus]
MIDCPQLLAAISRIITRLPDAAPELNALDGTLGDGDLGATLEHCAGEMRAAMASDAMIQAVNGDDPLMHALRTLSLACAKASGSSFGTLMAQGLLTAARFCHGKTTLSQSDFATLLHEVVAALAHRGGAGLGDKTLLDGLHALALALESQPAPADPRALMRATLEETLAAFRQRPNRIGRARMFAERSIGLDDPGQVALLRMVEAL